MAQLAINATMSVATIVEPTGVPAKMDSKIPITAQITDNTTEQTVTPKNVLYTRIADNAGNITSAEISKDPTKFMASTMITAVIIAINKL